MPTRILTFILTTLFLLLIPLPAFAQTPVPFGTGQALVSTPKTDSQLPSYVSPTSPLYTDLLVHNLFHSFSCLAVGQSVIGQPCLSYQVTQNAQGMIQNVPVLSQVNTSGGTLGAATSLIGMLYKNPPVRTADYIGSLGEQFGVVKEANAQVIGSGAGVLNPILRLWQVSRNISYMFMIIIFVIIGIMVMFRHKINPQTVITAQAALPGLVIGLILITFSYFLAGLVSDMAFIGTNVVGYYFSAVRGNPGDQNLIEEMSQKNAISIFAPFTKVVGQGDVTSSLNAIWDDLAVPGTNRASPLDLDPQKVITDLAMIVVTQFVLPFGNMFGGIGQIVVGGIAFGGTIWNTTGVVGLALSFIAMAILIYAMFRLLLRLINVYISIIFYTITAPFYFLAAALPGRQGIATGWILNMLAHILAFPAVLAVLYFVAFILGPKLDSVCPKSTCLFKIAHSNQTQNINPITPAYVQGTPTTEIKGITDTNTFPMFGGLELSFINLLLAFGALVALPSIPDIVNKAVGRMGQAGEMIGREISGSIGQGRQYAGQFQSGTSGFAGQVGRVTDESGTILTTKGFRKPISNEEMKFSGARAGQATRLSQSIRRLFSRGP